MQHFKALRTRIWLAISLILGFALVTFGCDTSKLAYGKNQVSDYSNIKISAETVPEGILVTFSNYSSVGASLNIIYDNISWLIDIAKTPVFTYSL